MRTNTLTLYRTDEELASTNLLRVDREAIGLRLHEVKEVWERDHEDDPSRLVSREQTGRMFVVHSIDPGENGDPHPDFEHVIVYRPDDFACIVLRRIDV